LTSDSEYQHVAKDWLSHLFGRWSPSHAGFTWKFINTTVSGVDDIRKDIYHYVFSDSLSSFLVVD
jgi:hypothetical protein